MSYPRFTKIIIDYFMSNDQSISRRNNMFWHTTRDDTMFASIRCISRHEDTQVYGTILPKELTNQEMLEYNAYKTYYTFASGEKAPKPKYVQKKVDPDTSPKQKPVQATKGDGVDTRSKVPDEQQQKTSGTDEGTGTIPVVPDVPIYESKSEKESWGDSEDEDDDDENDSDDLSDEGNDDNDGNDSNDGDGDDDDANDDDKQEGEDMNNDDEETDKEEEEYDDEFNIEEDEKMDEEEDDEVTKELYNDVNKADEIVQSSSVSSDFTSKLLNLKNPSPADNEIASLMETSARHATVVPEITSSFTITIPPPPPQFAEAVSSIPGIVDTFLASKMKEAVDVVVQLQTNKLREEAQAENQEFLSQVDSTMKAIIKEQVQTQVSKIIPKIEKYVTESLGAEVLVRSTNQPQTSYAVVASLSEFKLKKILIDKMETNKSIDRSDTQKNLYNALIKLYNIDKDIITSYGDVVILKRGRYDQDKDEDPSAGSDRGTKRRKSAHAKEPSHTVEDLGMEQDQEFITGDNDEQPANKEVTKAGWFKKPERPPTPDPD
ncbi:hypothetical protein Tco_0674480 [Tanacetum coccineum]